jgi:TRAP-type uncharacterized transport system substrate-binding protein
MTINPDSLLFIHEIIDVIISGLTNGSVYALMAVGLTLVYGVTKAFFQALPELSAFDTPPLRQMNTEDASATPIPLHEGAARYYREQGAM